MFSESDASSVWFCSDSQIYCKAHEETKEHNGVLNHAFWEDTRDREPSGWRRSEAQGWLNLQVGKKKIPSI